MDGITINDNNEQNEENKKNKKNDDFLRKALFKVRLLIVTISNLHIAI